jgi:hypothetical protein
MGAAAAAAAAYDPTGRREDDPDVTVSMLGRRRRL